MKRGVIPADLLAAFPKIPAGLKVGFPTPAQIAKSLAAIGTGWQTTVAPLLK
jgi:hypothetical protein